MKRTPFALSIVTALAAVLAAENAFATTAYDNFGADFAVNTGAGWNISGPGVFVDTPVLQGEQFVAQSSGLLTDLWIAGGWGRPYVENPALPGTELLATVAPVNADGSFNPVGAVSIQINPSTVGDWIAGGVVHVSGLSGAGITLQANQTYDLWLAVSGSNVFTWSLNNTGDTGDRLFSTDYEDPGLPFPGGIRGAFRIDVSQVPESGTFLMLLAGFGLVGVLGRPSAFARGRSPLKE
jgi:hypothetical protein